MSSGFDNRMLPPNGPPVVATTGSDSFDTTMGPANSMTDSTSQLPPPSQPPPQRSLQPAPPSRLLQPPLDQMRAYRACLNCRNRKSRCDLDINAGRPPCRRCQRENRECVLGESHRGGKRVRKKQKSSGSGESDTAKSTPLSANSQPQSSPSPFKTTDAQSPHYNANLSHHTTPSSEPFHSRYDSRESGFTWQNSTPASTTSESGFSRLGDRNFLHPTSDYRSQNGSRSSLVPKLGDSMNDNIASVDLQNPSDALEILAQVADQAENGSSPSSASERGHARRRMSKGKRAESQHQTLSSDSNPAMISFKYKPFLDGLIDSDTIYRLFSSYEDLFHPFFPIIPKQTFDRSGIPKLSRAEPHLFSAILTIASKDHDQIHKVCYDHMQQLISMILAGADANVEAVEALLLLSQWVSHRPQADVAIGRGEEDRVAWMYIGTALRLGYYLGLDRTAFKPDSNEDLAKFNRNRLTWTACYICDRLISVRVGKGFWARGPGPMSGLRSNDFPTLQPASATADNYALIFQANLELTQIFSNVHDILYSSKGHGWKEMLEGRYVKYLDDFRMSIRSWNDTWGNLDCAPCLKSTLLLTYDYLRLYVNAFAYQATISRALTMSQINSPSGGRPSIPQINASTPDARFIYESLDAAKSLLTTFNNFVEPRIFRYMPSSYYLFVIYSAVFLYKARSTTTMTETERLDVRKMITETIDRLLKASTGQGHMGSRYARLLQLLWRKPPKRTAQPQLNHDSDTGPSTVVPKYEDIPVPYASQLNNPAIMPPVQTNGGGAGTFSWLDLEGTWTYATNNNGGASVASTSGGSAGELDEFAAGAVGEGVMFDLNSLGEYGFLGGGEGEGFVF